MKVSALGKKIPDLRQRKKMLMKGSAFNKLLQILKNTDWAHTPVYHQFQRNDRWKHEDATIYSETELKYNLGFLAKLQAEHNINEARSAAEKEELVATYFKKTMHTVEVLMNQLNMMYYLEKIRLIFVDEEPTIQHLTKLMTRCLKLYESINQFIKAFKLIQKKEVSNLIFLTVI